MLRKRLVYAIPLLFAALSAWDLLSHLSRPLIAPHPDPITRNDIRFSPLRSSLRLVPQAGYRPFPTPDDDPMRYYLAQYALAPTILMPMSIGLTVMDTTSDPVLIQTKS